MGYNILNMRQKLKRTLIIIFSAILFTLVTISSSLAATSIDPALKWKTLETPHFSINYYPGLEEVANRLAPIAEEVNSLLTKVLKTRLDMKTQVTLLDVTDFGNGMTTVFPYPAITLYLTDLSSNLSPYKYDDYLRYLFTHEYTHALHLDISEGGPSIFRAIFGRMMFPNAMEPNFMTEGIATYIETEYTQAGRARDPRWQMMMRMDVLEDHIKSIDQASVNTAGWPDGSLRYLYGVMFLEYLSQKYGETKLVSLVHVYGDFLFSIGIDGAFVFIYGKNLSMLWNEWLDDMGEKYQKQVAGLGKLTEPNYLTNTGYYNVKPKWSKDNAAIYYLQRNADDYPQIRSYNFKTGQDHKILEAQISEDTLSFAPDGKSLYFSKYDIYRNYYEFKDLYRLSLEDGKVTRLTEGARAGDPALSPDGKKIAYIKIDRGTSAINLLENGMTRTLVSGEINVQYFSPIFSPAGDYLAVAKHQKNGDQKMVMINLASGREEIVNPADQGVSEGSPVFSPAGEYLFFDSDRTGIVNLYAFHLDSRRLYQVTNVAGGAMMPDVSPDGRRLAYVSYSSRGYDIAEMDINSSDWKVAPVSPESSLAPIISRVNPPSYEAAAYQFKKYEIHDYDPLPSLMPKFWIPYNYLDENGPNNSIYIGGLDPLMQHLYYLNFGYDFIGGRPSYSFYYINNQYLPQITVGLNDAAVPYGWNNHQIYWERQREATLLFSFIQNRFLKEYDSQSFTFGFRSLNLSNISSLDALAPTPSLGDLNSFILAWNYNGSRSYAYSVAPEDGLDLGLMVEMFSPALGSNYALTNYSARLNNYTPMLFKHHNLSTSINLFYSKGDKLQQGNLSSRYVYPRGYAVNNLQGNKGGLLTLAYNFPLWYTERGFYYGNTFLDRVWGDVFFDEGAATFGPPDSLVYKRGIGAELNFNLSTFWDYAAFIIKLGFARGLDTGGSDLVYFDIGL
jgi:Tol biopolymer transport system component